MKLREYEGKAMFAKYGIQIPPAKLLDASSPIEGLGSYPCVVKAQTLFGDRLKHGGILFINNDAELKNAVQKLLGQDIMGEKVEHVLLAKKIESEHEYYVSISYSTETRTPVLSLAHKGGSGVQKAHTVPIDITIGLPGFVIRDALIGARFQTFELNPLIDLIGKLWKLFTEEYALLAEINPVFLDSEGHAIAGDAKIILDDEKIKPGERRYIELGGDIAILASGGGASLLNIDSLLAAGGRPANYTEYSGNPPAEVVSELTQRVLGRSGLKGCWVIGGTANFTDIFETLRGFLDGLRLVKPKPMYPIVIRRDGPRKAEAFALLKEISEKEGFDFHCYDSHTPMDETARIITKLSYKKGKSS